MNTHLVREEQMREEVSPGSSDVGNGGDSMRWDDDIRHDLAQPEGSGQHTGSGRNYSCASSHNAATHDFCSNWLAGPADVDPIPGSKCIHSLPWQRRRSYPMRRWHLLPFLWTRNVFSPRW